MLICVKNILQAEIVSPERCRVDWFDDVWAEVNLQSAGSMRARHPLRGWTGLFFEKSLTITDKNDTLDMLAGVCSRAEQNRMKSPGNRGFHGLRGVPPRAPGNNFGK